MQKTGIVKQLGDSDFQAKLLADPHQTLRENGVDLPASTEVKVVRNSKTSVNIVVPASNSEEMALSDSELATLAAAGEVILAVTFISLSVAGIVAAIGATGLTIAHATDAL